MVLIVGSPAEELAPAVVRGRVLDPSGAVVPGAVIRLLRQDGTVAVASDHNGSFRAASLRPGDYAIEAESAGFAPFSRRAVTLGPGALVDIDIVLRLSSLSEAVTVTAKAPAGEGALETSSSNTRERLEIREVRESAAKDVGEALANLDGLWKIRKGGIANDVVLRGFQQGNVNVLIDGQRIYSACPSHMDPAASHVDFAEIETVEVTKGAFDIRNQGSLAGTVNVVSKKPVSGFQVTPNLGAGSFGFWNPSLTASFSSGGLYGLAGYSYRRSLPYIDGMGRSMTAYANYTPSGAANDAFDIHTGWGRFGVELAPNQSLEFAYTRQNGGLTLYPVLLMDAGYDNADRLSANWSVRDLTGVVKQVRAQAYFTRVKHWMTDALRTSGVGKPLGYSMASFAGTKAAGGRVEAELSGTVVGVEAYNRGWGVATSLMSNGLYFAQPSLPDVRMVVGGFYAQHYRTFGRFTVMLGGRLDAAASEATNRGVNTDLYWAYHGTRGTSATDVNPSGSIRGTYLLPRGIELFVGVGSSVRVPDPEERYYDFKRMGTDWVGNPGLAPTRNNEADLGINLRSRRFSLRPTVFYSRLSDYVVLRPQPKLNSGVGVMNMTARSYEGVEARIYGGEIAWSAGLSRALLLAGGVAYTRGIQLAKPETGMRKGDIAEMPPLKSRASLRYGGRLFFAEVNGIASAPQNRVDRSLLEQRTPGYALLGCKAGVHHRQFQFSAGIDNLTDRFYYEHLSFQRDPYRSGIRIPEPGRMLYVNVSMLLDRR
ncbi:MAG: TonB-dependent receptor [Acidobacteria bacterium]|nr:TonB-dependent receptor [Acidobacteriota bacterium]